MFRTLFEIEISILVKFQRQLSKINSAFFLQSSFEFRAGVSNLEVLSYLRQPGRFVVTEDISWS